MSLDLSADKFSYARERTLGSLTGLSTRDFTASIWVKWSFTTAWADILNLSQGGDSDEMFRCRLLSTGHQFLISTGAVDWAGRTTITGAINPVIQDSWTHVLYVNRVTGSGPYTCYLDIYINGGSALTPSGTHTWTDPPSLADFTSLRLGQQRAGDGDTLKIAEVAYWEGQNPEYRTDLAAGKPANKVGSPAEYYPLKDSGFPKNSSDTDKELLLYTSAAWDSSDHPSISLGGKLHTQQQCRRPAQ